MEISQSICHLGIVVQKDFRRRTKNSARVAVFADIRDTEIINCLGLELNVNNTSPYMHSNIIEDGKSLENAVFLDHLGKSWNDNKEVEDDLYYLNWVGKAYVKIPWGDDPTYKEDMSPVMFSTHDEVVDKRRWKEISTAEAKRLLNCRIIQTKIDKIEQMEKELN